MGRVRIVIGLLLGIAAFAGFAGDVFVAKNQAQVRIGALLPLSGALAAFGEQARVGINLAIQEINETGGIKGMPLKVIYFDTQTDTEFAVRGALEFLREKQVLAVVGPITSSVRNAVLPLHKRYKTPLLYATNYEGGECSPYLFSFNTIPHQELAALVPELISQAGPRVFLVGNDYAWPRRSFRLAKRLIKKHGGRVVGESFLPFGTDEFSDLLQQIRKQRADVVIKAVPGAEGVALANKINREFEKPPAIGYLGLSEVYLSAVDPPATNLWVSTPFVQSLDNEAATRFVRSAKALTDAQLPVSHYMLSHYNAVMGFGHGLRKARRMTRKSLISSLTGLKFQTLTGSISVGKKTRHATMPMFLARGSGKTLSVVSTLPAVKPVNACHRR